MGGSEAEGGGGGGGSGCADAGREAVVVVVGDGLWGSFFVVRLIGKIWGAFWDRLLAGVGVELRVSHMSAAARPQLIPAGIHQPPRSSHFRFAQSTKLLMGYAPMFSRTWVIVYGLRIHMRMYL